MSDPTPHLERFESYEQACREFKWIIPERFNIAREICRRHSDAISRIALKEMREAGINTYTFGALDFLSDKFAVALSESGIKPGDSVVVMLPQSAAMAVAHLGVLKTGAVLVPLPMDASSALLDHAMANSGPKAVVVDESVNALAGDYESGSYRDLRFVVRDLRPSAAMSSGDKDFWTEVDRASSDFDSVETDANSRAFIFYGESEGKPAGVVHSHRSLLGQLPSFEMWMEPDSDSVFWIFDAWSSANALLGTLFPAWWYGCCVVADRSDDRDAALSLIERGAVTHACVPSSALNIFADLQQPGHERLELMPLRVVCNSLPWPEDWDGDPRVTLNCVYGRPETGWIAGCSQRWSGTASGSAANQAPGRTIEIIDETGRIAPPGQEGRIGIHKSDPALFSEFHEAPERTAEAFAGDWHLTGDIGKKNEDGDLSIHHPLT